VQKEGENDVKDTSEYGKSGVQLARLGWEHIILLSLHTGLGVIQGLEGIVN
jgi:hypothetical protein